jgi:sugar-specific transcriptional regulator TrmB
VLGLSSDEATIYLEFLKGRTSHFKLAQATGINRTKVYGLADQLENRSLVTKRVDDRGMALVATGPSTLEVELETQREERTTPAPALPIFLISVAQSQRRNSHKQASQGAP